MKFWIPFLFVLLASSTAWAQDLNGRASGTGFCSRSTAGTELNSISYNTRCFYVFTDGTNSNQFRVIAEYLTLLFDPDDSTQGAATAEMQLRHVKGDCSPGSAGVANESEIVSEGGVAITLTGAVGADAIYEVPKGCYYIDVTQASGGETAVVTLEGATK